MVYTALGSMIFAGGFTLGMQTQFEVVAHLEHGNFGVETARRNLRLPVHTNFTDWPTDSFRGVDVVYANPACSPWSICGRSLTKGQDSWKTDKNFTSTYMARMLLGRLRPKVWVSESVCLILSRGREYVDSLIYEAAQMGYAVTLFQLDPKLWGLPQQRRRVFLIVHRVDIPLDLWQAARPPCTVTTIGMALKDVPDPGHYRPIPEQWRELVHRLPQGKWLARLWEQERGLRAGAGFGSGEKVIGRPRFEMHRLRADRPADSLTGGSDSMIHPWEDRFLGVNEFARLCGYPADYIWPQALSRATAELGKGVTVTAATVLAGVLRQALDRNERALRGSVTQVDFRATQPRLACYTPVNLIRRDYDGQTLVLPRRVELPV